jgi:hypothetical protein
VGNSNMAAIYSNGVTAGIFLASILLKEMQRYLVHIRYLWWLLNVQLFKNSIDTQGKLRLNPPFISRIHIRDGKLVLDVTWVSGSIFYLFIRLIAGYLRRETRLIWIRRQTSFPSALSRLTYPSKLTGKLDGNPI